MRGDAVKITVRDAGFAYAPDGRKALDGVSFDVRENEFLCIVGPSGCGKTTFLKLLAGLLEPAAGQIAHRRDGAPGAYCSVVFQDLALFPWKTVSGNVSFGLRFQAKSKAEVARITASYIRKMNLAGFEDYYPHQLSGGMRQRVALARAFAADPRVLLMDEPFNSLDVSTRWLLVEELLRLCGESSPKTVIFTTHSIDEALLLADRVVVLTSAPGRVKRILEVPLPRPRTMRTREDPRFAKLAGEIWDILETEVRNSLS